MKMDFYILWYKFSNHAIKPYFYCQDKITEKINLKGKRFILTHGYKGFSS